MPKSPESEGSRLITLKQIEQEHGVSRSALHNYRRSASFPQPVPAEGSTKIQYDAREVAAWFEANPPSQGKRTDLAHRDEGTAMPQRQQPTMRERTTVSLTQTHWEMLRTQAHLKAWVEARQMGLTVEQCDRIADAAFDGVREQIEEWAQQQAGAQDG